MARRKTTRLAFDALMVEGALIAPDMIADVAALKATAQSESDYRIPPGLKLRDEIGRSWRIAEALWGRFSQARSGGSLYAATQGFVDDLLRQVFGFASLEAVALREVGGRAFPVRRVAQGGRVPIAVAPAGEGLDRGLDQFAVDHRKRSASLFVQELLNADDAARWGIATDGLTLRLLRDNASLTRPAYIEADLERMFRGGLYADFVALWLLIHESRFGAVDAAPSDCALERWREAGREAGAKARDRLGAGVETALAELGSGFIAHPANGALRAAIEGGTLTRQTLYEELLRLVYRLIFLFTTEDRGLLHGPKAGEAAKALYADGYSLARLRVLSARRAARDANHDLHEGLRIVFRALWRGEKALGLPALGGLFQESALPNIGGAKISNKRLLEAIFRLAWITEDHTLTRVNWRDMETEELGSVYEALLELTPHVDLQARSFFFAEGGATKGNARKTTGSYYTPDSLVQALLDSALDPVLGRVEAEADDPAQALLGVTVIDPACGSGHFLLAAARRIATRLARARTDGAASAGDYRHALRDVARACLHGVDRNPMAVELTKVALWIETVEPGKPLGFLDANIRCGDSLLGLFDLEALRQGIPDAAYDPLSGDERETARHFKARNKDEKKGQGALDFAGGGKLPAPPPLAAAARALHALPEDSVEEIAEKRRRFEAARSGPESWAWRVAADLYAAAFLMPKTGGAPANRNTVTIPTSAHVWQALSGGQVYGPLVGRCQDLAGKARAFHWPLEFPDLMAAGGFDVVLGNPPWERIKLQEQEFFAAREPGIAQAPNAAARGKMIAALKAAEPGSREHALFEEFETAKRIAEASSVFARVLGEEGGRFPLTGRGDVNTYALFAELFAALTSPRGRAGVIVPTGIATDSTTAPFFSSLIDRKRLLRLVSFENEEFIFPSVHHSFRFCLLTVGDKGLNPEFAFFIRRVEQLAEPERAFTLSAADIARINPNTKTAPVFRARADAELTAKIYGRVPVLIDEARGPKGNPWGLSFMRMLDMSNDSGLFRTAALLRGEGFVRDGTDWILPSPLAGEGGALASAPGEGMAPPHPAASRPPSPARGEGTRYVPLYEAKMIHQFDHRWATYDGTDSRDATLAEKADPGFEPVPRYWVPEAEVASRLAAKNWTRSWLMGWRDITSAHVLRTVISTAFPRVGVGNNLPLMLFDSQTDAQTLAALVGCLSSLVCDCIARHKVGGTHLNFFIYQQLPVLPPSAYCEAGLAFIVPRVLELTYTSHSMAPFARDLGFEGKPFAWDEDRRANLRAELDAWYARAYGLSRDELRYILDPADVKGPDYPSETFRVLKTNEIRRFGEYRTARLVLEAWDRMERGEQ